MKLPHWFRHAWSNWAPADKPHNALVDGYDIRYTTTDIRTCTRCGRRQLRSA